MTTLEHTHVTLVYTLSSGDKIVFDNTYVDVIYLKVRINKGKVNSM